MKSSVKLAQGVEALFGTFDENLKLLEKSFGVSTHLANDTLEIEGEEVNVRRVQSLVEDYGELLERGAHFEPAEVQSFLKILAEDKGASLKGLAEFDPQVEIQNYLTAKAAYEALVDQITAKKADEAAARAKDDTDLMQAEDALKKAQLEILKDPILSPNDVKTNQLNLDEATAKLKQFKVTYALKRQSAQADIRDFEIQAEMKRLDMLQAQQNEKVMVVRSPANGIVVVNSTWKGNGMGPFEVGDSLRPGRPFIRIVNPAHMQARIDVNQLDYPFIHAGQPAVFHLDAYPGTAFPGTLESVSPIANASDFSDKVRTLSALAEVQGSDPRLMPDLSAAVDVQIEALPDALVIPRGSIILDHGKTYVLLKSGLGFDRHEVKLGPMNDTQAVVESGLQAGDVVKKTVTSGEK